MDDASDIAVETLISMLERRDFRRHLISEINDDVDIPMIGERTEQKVLNAIYKALLRALRRLET
jgi:hypothetical protein